MAINVNPKTGLKESFDDFYKLPLVHQRNIGTLRLDGQPKAVHTVPIGSGRTLDFISLLGRNDELIVALHGANMAERNFYPRFERVNSLRTKTKALIAFADPTLKSDPDKNMLLSWFLGGPGWDPSIPILKVIEKAQRKVGAKHVAFIGGSGGGYAALRLSAMVPGSLAFVQDPQTVISNYLPKVVNRYFDTVWPSWNPQMLADAFPERFDMVRHYQELRPQNFVYYTQSRSDTMHYDSHYTPFKAAAGVKETQGMSRMRTRNFVLYDGEIPGHGNITPAEFDKFYTRAMNYWRENR
ncbi:hypothetical protein [Glutamicibacter sp. HZAU]|uniref:hypothetical protein n=1 Tax=Glutamicibacter sp. HZAU TaxID=2049891 RepID=UPI000FFC0A56|nr:hypothetical protein [Glutamicibacter sp. HZAU]RWZ83809.1 hypothetical protein EKH49_08410 [Glutamicibacter sp. HZAU]